MIRVKDIFKFLRVNKAAHAIKQGRVVISNGKKIE